MKVGNSAGFFFGCWEVEGGALSLLLFAEEVYAGTSRALFLLGSILGVVTFTGTAKITFYDTMVLL